MNTFYSAVKKICLIILGTVFLCFLAVALVVHAKYDFDDFPFFAFTSLPDCGMLLLAGALLAMAYRFRHGLERILDPRMVTVVFFAVSLLFVISVPLKPFSDMEQIYDGALAVSRGDGSFFAASDYFRSYPNNIFICCLYGVFFLLLPDNMLTLKVLNIVLTVCIALLTYKTLALLTPVPYKNLFYCAVLCFLSPLLYCNHIYTDTPFAALSLLAVYLFFRWEHGYFISSFLLAVLFFIRPVAAIYMIALFIVVLFGRDRNFRESARWSMTALCRAVGGLLVFLAVLMGCSWGIQVICPSRQSSIPPASYLYMGLNEEEFGFQDNTHTPDRTMEDVAERISSYTPSRLLKILGKKTFWTWTEGTYQANRYALGQDVSAAADKFACATPVTPYILNSGQTAYTLLESAMRAQYLLLCAAALLGAWRTRKDSRWDVIILLFAGFFLFYLVWEIKSRYLFSLYPFLFMLAYAGTAGRFFRPT